MMAVICERHVTPITDMVKEKIPDTYDLYYPGIYIHIFHDTVSYTRVTSRTLALAKKKVGVSFGRFIAASPSTLDSRWWSRKRVLCHVANQDPPVRLHLQKRRRPIKKDTTSTSQTSQPKKATTIVRLFFGERESWFQVYLSSYPKKYCYPEHFIN